MNLPSRRLTLTPLEVKGKSALALDTGFEADSLEGMRLVKASRGSGWFYSAGVLTPWTTQGVLQAEGRLVVWGELSVPAGTSPEWPLEGKPGRQFVQAFVRAWTARAAASDPLPAFSPSAVVPYQTAQGWAFAFLPPELQSVLDSLQPLSDRLAWEHVRHPDAAGAASWAFASAALAWSVLGPLPWTQGDETHLRQEIRDLKKTLTRDELPEGPDALGAALWFESLGGKASSAAPRWKAWAEDAAWDSVDPAAAARRTAASAKRTRRRAGSAFWRRRGTLTIALSAAGLAVAAVVGTVVWGVIKPDPSDLWTPEQVVRGYYEALSTLDAEQMRRLVSPDKNQPRLSRDQDEASNVFVIRQIRTAYEHKSPIVAAQEWEAAGRPPLAEGQMLYGIAGFQAAADGDLWTVTYRKWVSESAEGKLPTPVGLDVADTLKVVKTGRGWKISDLQREARPLP